MLAAGLIIAAAVAFCGSTDAIEPRCGPSRVEPAAITEAHQATFQRLASEARLGARYGREAGTADVWRVRAPPQPGDCEDRLLWAAGELRRLHPELTNAYRFVAIEQGVEYVGARRIRRMHVVLVIEAQSGERFVLDTQFGRLRSWADYDQHRAFSPASGLGAQWEPY